MAADQVTFTELAQMTPEQIVEARKSGRFDDMFAGDIGQVELGRATPADFEKMLAGVIPELPSLAPMDRAKRIVAARASGLLDNILGG